MKRRDFVRTALAASLAHERNGPARHGNILWDGIRTSDNQEEAAHHVLPRQPPPPHVHV